MTDWTPEPVNWDPTNFEGLMPESWECIDCGLNTAPLARSTARVASTFILVSALFDVNRRRR
jgi:hypothetical protein